MQIVLMLAERHEQAAAQRLGSYREQINAEQQQLQQLEESAAQSLDACGYVKAGLPAQELISYRSFIQGLGDAKKEQHTEGARMMQTLDQPQKDWQGRHLRQEPIQN